MNIKTYTCGEYFIYTLVMSSFPSYIRSVENTFRNTSIDETRTVEYWYGFNSPFNYYIWGGYNREIIVFHDTDLVLSSNKQLKVRLI